MKRSKIKETNVLREYVKQILLSEQDGGDSAGVSADSYYSGYSGTMGGGPAGGYSASSVKGIVGPALTDILKAGMALFSKTAAGIKRLVKIGFEGMAELLTGGILEAEYEKIHSEYNSEISSITSKYADSIGRSWDVLKTSAAPLAMLYSPSIYLTSKIIADNPRASANVAAVFAIAGAPLVGSTLGITGISGGGYLSGATAAKGIALAAAARKATSESKNRLLENDSSVIKNNDIKNIADEVKVVYDDMINSSRGMLRVISKTLLNVQSNKNLSPEQQSELRDLLTGELNSIIDEKNKIVNGLKQQNIPSGIFLKDPLVLKLGSLINEYNDAISMIVAKQLPQEK